MNNISRFSIVSYPTPVTWGQTLHNLIDGILYIPHLQKTYTVKNPKTMEATLEETPPIAKDYLLTAVKIGLFVLAGIKASAFMTPPVVIATFAFFVTLVIIDKMSHRFVLEENIEKKKTPIEGEKGKLDIKSNVNTSNVFKASFSEKPIVQPIVLEKCLDLFNKSFEASSNNTNIRPNFYILNAFNEFSTKLTVTDPITAANAILLIASKKEEVISQASKALGEEKKLINKLSTQFDEAIKGIVKSAFNKHESFDDVIKACMLRKQLPTLEIDNEFKILLLKQIPNEESFLKNINNLKNLNEIQKEELNKWYTPIQKEIIIPEKTVIEPVVLKKCIAFFKESFESSAKNKNIQPVHYINTAFSEFSTKLSVTDPETTASAICSIASKKEKIMNHAMTIIGTDNEIIKNKISIHFDEELNKLVKSIFNETQSFKGMIKACILRKELPSIDTDDKLLVQLLNQIPNSTIFLKNLHNLKKLNNTQEKEIKKWYDQINEETVIQEKIIIQPIVLEDCLSLFTNSFEVSKNNKIPVPPKGYITTAFQQFTERLAVTDSKIAWEVFFSIASDKEAIIQSALEAIGNEKSKDLISKEFDIEMGVCLKELFKDFEKQPHLALLRIASYLHQNLLNLEFDKNLEKSLSEQLPIKKSFITATYSLIRSSWNAFDAKEAIQMTKQCFGKDDADQLSDSLLSELLQNSKLSTKQILTWESLITDKHKSQFVLLKASSLIDICWKTISNKPGIHEIQELFEGLKKLLPEKIKEHDRESIAFKTLKNNFKAIVEHMDWTLGSNKHLYTDSLYIAYNSVAKILDFPKKALLVNQRKIYLQNKVNNGTANEDEQIEYVELLSLENN